MVRSKKRARVPPVRLQNTASDKTSSNVDIANATPSEICRAFRIAGPPSPMEEQQAPDAHLVVKVEDSTCPDTCAYDRWVGEIEKMSLLRHDGSNPVFRTNSFVPENAVKGDDELNLNKNDEPNTKKTEQLCDKIHDDLSVEAVVFPTSGVNDDAQDIKNPKIGLPDETENIICSSVAQDIVNISDDKEDDQSPNSFERFKSEMRSRMSELERTVSEFLAAKQSPPDHRNSVYPAGT